MAGEAEGICDKGGQMLLLLNQMAKNTVMNMVFDLDGTLVDTREANYLAYREAFARHNLELSREIYERSFGKKWEEWGPEIARERASQIHDAKIESFGNYIPLVKPIEIYVHILKSSFGSHRTVLATSASRKCTRMILDHFDLRFSDEFYGEDYPDKRSMLVEIKKNVMARLKDTLLIDDNQDNIKLADELGFRTHLAVSGGRGMLRVQKVRPRKTSQG